MSWICAIALSASESREPSESDTFSSRIMGTDPSSLGSSTRSALPFPDSFWEVILYPRSIPCIIVRTMFSYDDSSLSEK